MAKDLFSDHSADYKRFRPRYPSELFAFIAKQCQQHNAAWDCGTGNGQGAIGLAPYFNTIHATDLSANQVAQGEQADNIHYGVATAENSGLDDNSVNLVSVFQALHWFDLDKFFAECQRVLTPGGILAVVGYNTALTGIDSIDAVYREFCFQYLWDKACWSMERSSLNSNYDSVDFPYTAIDTPQLFIEMQWNYQDYIHYLNTWSAVKTYHKKFSKNAVDAFVVPKIQHLWPDPEQKRSIKFPVIFRCGRFD